MSNEERELAAAKTREAIDKATSVMKQAKEEILTTAWKQAPAKEEVERFDMVDQFIRHYLIKHFNAEAYTWLKATPEDAVFTIHCLAESSKEGAQISQDEVKKILDKCAAKAPSL
jgi:hypothetical protein